MGLKDRVKKTEKSSETHIMDISEKKCKNIPKAVPVNFNGEEACIVKYNKDGEKVEIDDIDVFVNGGNGELKPDKIDGEIKKIDSNNHR